MTDEQKQRLTSILDLISPSWNAECALRRAGRVGEARTAYEQAIKLQQGLAREGLFQDYTLAPSGQSRWFPASEGLATVHAVISELETKLASAERKADVESRIRMLQVVEDKLDSIGIKDYKLHLLARDLG